MESEKMMAKTPIGQIWRRIKAWGRVLLIKDGCQSIVYLQDNVKLARKKTQDIYTSVESKGNKQETLLSQNCSRTEIYIYQQCKMSIAAKLTMQNTK
jgi:hypothetical protein